MIDLYAHTLCHDSTFPFPDFYTSPSYNCASLRSRSSWLSIELWPRHRYDSQPVLHEVHSTEHSIFGTTLLGPRQCVVDRESEKSSLINDRGPRFSDRLSENIRYRALDPDH